MKKLYTLSLALLSVASMGQATRLALFEEFTGENCGPCAATNPTLDALVQNNPTKVLMLKHQVPIPSAGPIYNGYPTDADNRRSYYGVNSAPNGRLDGAAFGGQTHPYYLTQAIIDNRAAVTSSFSMTTSHTLSSDLDSIFITVTVSNADNFTVTSGSTGSLKLHVSVIEEEINFPTPPGTNGEADFYHVNRKMYPSANGTTMADSWAVGSSQTFTFAEELPMHIYNYGEIGVVAYIQDDSNKEVMQASHSAKQPAPAGIPDMTIANTTASGGDLCAGSVTPSFEIENLTSAACTSADVRYRINGGAWTTQAWTGNLAQGQKATVTFSQTNLPYATNTIEAQVVNPNGSRDVNSLNNEIVPFTLNVLSPIVAAAPFDVNFENASLGQIPSNLILNDNTGRVFTVDQGISSGVTWNLGAYEASAKSIRFDYYTIQAGEVSELIMQKVDISNVPNAKVFFAHAYQMYQNENDALEVLVSGDCGQTWTSIWSRAGANMVTTAAPSNTNRLYPRAADWTYNYALIPGALQSSDELIVKFVGTSDYGNALYVDNIWVSANAIGVEEEDILNDVVLFPNPANQSAEIRFEAVEAGDINIAVTDLNGRVMSNTSREISTGIQSISLDVANYPAGVYMVEVRQNNSVKTLRLSVSH